MKRVKLLLLSLVAILAIGSLALFSAKDAYAECYVPTGCADESGSDSRIATLTGGVYAITLDVSSAVGAVAAAMVMWASIQYSISLGNPGKAQKAKQTIIFAAIGVLIGFAANIIVGVAVSIGGGLHTGADVAAIISQIGNFIRNTTAAAGVMAVLVGAIMMVSSAGNPAKVQNGKKSIIAGIIGVLIAVFAHILTIILVLVFKGGTVSGGAYVVEYDDQGNQTIASRNVTDSISSESVSIVACKDGEPEGTDCMALVKKEAKDVQKCLSDEGLSYAECRENVGAKYVTYPDVFEYGDQEKILCKGVTKKYVLYNPVNNSESALSVREIDRQGVANTEVKAAENMDINMSNKCSDSVDSKGRFLSGMITYSPNLGVAQDGAPQYTYHDTVCSAGENDDKVTCKVRYVVNSCDPSNRVNVRHDFEGKGIWNQFSQNNICRESKEAGPKRVDELTDPSTHQVMYEYDSTVTDVDNDGTVTITYKYRKLQHDVSQPGGNGGNKGGSGGSSSSSGGNGNGKN